MTKVTMHELRTKKVMTEEQIAVFNELLNNADFKGKKSLRHLLWLNTVAPKFEVGDTVVIHADGSHRIWDIPVRRAVGKVKEISVFMTSNEYRYCVECIYEKDGKQYTANEYGGEADIMPADELIVNTKWN